MKYRIYLDNCCFNRPYDDQKQLRIYLETQAKLHIQSLVYEKKIMTYGIKAADAVHVACAIAGKCDYFITVDKRLLTFQDKQIKICNPIEFINHIEL